MGVYGNSALLPSKQEYISTYAGVPLEETKSLAKEMKSRFMGNMEAMGQTVSSLNQMYENVSDKDRGMIDAYNEQAKSLMQNISENENAWEKATMPIVNFAMDFAGDEKVKEAQIIKTTIGEQKAKYDALYSSGDMDAERYKWHMDNLEQSYAGLDSYGDEWKTARGDIYNYNPAKFYDLASVAEKAASNFKLDESVALGPDGKPLITDISPGVLGITYNKGINKAQVERYLNGLVQSDANAKAYYAEVYEIKNGRAPTSEELSGYIGGMVKEHVDKIAHNQTRIQTFSDPSYSKTTTGKKRKYEIQTENLKRQRSMNVEVGDYKDIDSYTQDTIAVATETARAQVESSATAQQIKDKQDEAARIELDETLSGEQKIELQSNLDLEVKELISQKNALDLTIESGKHYTDVRTKSLESARAKAREEIEAMSNQDLVDYNEVAETAVVAASTFGLLAPPPKGISEERMIEKYGGETLFEANQNKAIEKRADEIMVDRNNVVSDYIAWAIDKDNIEGVSSLVLGDIGFVDAKGRHTVTLDKDAFEESSGGTMFKLDKDLNRVEVDITENDGDALQGKTARITAVMLNPESVLDPTAPKSMIEIVMVDPEDPTKSAGTYYVLSPQNLMTNMVQNKEINEINLHVTDALMKVAATSLYNDGDADALSFVPSSITGTISKENEDGDMEELQFMFEVGREFDDSEDATYYTRIKYMDEDGNIDYRYKDGEIIQYEFTNQYAMTEAIMAIYNSYYSIQ